MLRCFVESTELRAHTLADDGSIFVSTSVVKICVPKKKIGNDVT